MTLFELFHRLNRIACSVNSIHYIKTNVKDVKFNSEGDWKDWNITIITE